jgi:putative hydrolase of the HAD superfamily
MTMHKRAVLFDLDDTLYRERRYALSGFRYLAGLLEATAGIDAARSFGLLASSLRHGRRATALQALCVSVGFSHEAVPSLVDVMRGHMPSLGLPMSSVCTLEALRADFRLGIVTNGFPGVQRRKVAALGVERLVDTVVYAYEHGGGLGKPDAEPFLAAADRLGVTPEACVFVGDDLHRDIAGARGAGMRTIWVMRGSVENTNAVDFQPDANTTTVADVIRLAPSLLTEKSSRCA